jgi:hypothetical protein
MPKLDDLGGYRSLAHILNVVFRGGGPQQRQSAALVRNYIRIVDHLIIEYQSARDALTSYVNTPNEVMGPLFVATGHFESVITSLKRAQRFLERIKRDRAVPSVDKELAVISKEAIKKVTDIRDAIEHLDEKVIKGKIEEGESIALLVKSDGVELLGTEIKYTELAKWIRELDTVSNFLSTYTEESLNA